MNWINDVKLELDGLDTSPKSLRKFAFLVGTIFLILAGWLLWRDYALIFFSLSGCIGILLLLLGMFPSRLLQTLYKLWMGFAFAIGWIVSRILLIVIYYLILTTVGLIAKLFQKEFLDIKFRDGRESYWLKRNKEKKVNYEKMY